MPVRTNTSARALWGVGILRVREQSLQIGLEVVVRIKMVGSCNEGGGGIDVEQYVDVGTVGLCGAAGEKAVWFASATGEALVDAHYGLYLQPIPS
jgi:hypothetical protein